MGKTISRDTPLAEITLRKYERPMGLEKRELVKKLCLSLGLLQPGDSRDVVVDVFQVILENCRAGEGSTSVEIERMTIENRKKYDLPLFGIAPSNVRRQILRLRDLFLIEKVGNFYRVNEDAKLSELFREKLEMYYLNSIISRVKEYVEEVDSVFQPKKDVSEQK
jgi:hypothetical protein